jgi:hypothetical protein
MVELGQGENRASGQFISLMRASPVLRYRLLAQFVQRVSGDRRLGGWGRVSGLAAIE